MNSWKNHTTVSGLLAILFILSLTGCQSTITSTSPSTAVTVTNSTSQPTIAKPSTNPTSQSTTGAQVQTLRIATDTVFSIFTTADFSGPGICVACHINLKDQTGADVSMPTAWRSTMMANAAKDPVWQAKVSSEVERFPKLQDIIEKKCTTCHMPMAKTQAVNDGKTIAALGDGFLNAANPLHTAAMDGVSCTLCHQIQDKNLGLKESFSGGYTIDTQTNPPGRLVFGPYQQPVAQQMQNQSGFTPTYSAHMNTAEHCGTCHNLYTPFVDAQGNILGEFPEQTPYTEWQYSQFGATKTSCQSCHMPQANGGVVISILPGRLAARQPFYQHYFVGGNAFMLQILSDWGADLEVAADVGHLRTTQARVVAQISQKTAQLKLSDIELKDNTLTAKLQVNSLAGHKFPTSFPSRRAWLHVTVTDSAGQVIFQSGQPNANGAITGNAADFDPNAFEPHYDVITQDDQVQIYEPIMGDNEGKVTYTLLRGAQYLKDNRLLPVGAEKLKLPTDIGVYGDAAGDMNFVGGSDVVTYQMSMKSATGPFTFKAELLYEPLSYQFIQDLLMDKTSLTERFSGYYQQADKKPLVVTTISPVIIK